jgi:hypothetical protein
VAGIGTSITARAQSRDRVTVLEIWPFGTMITSPSTERSRVTQITDGARRVGPDAGGRDPD